MTAGLLGSDPLVLGPYRLMGRLGGGGMGRVYLAKSPGDGLVAVKVIRPEFAADPEFRARFAREVANARNVSGAFTAQLVDADATGPVPWLATAYIAGPPLSDAVRDNGPLPMGSLLPLARGLVKALSAIHGAGVVHRDLKPSNVLLAEDGPRVIDFGVSYAVEATALTQTGAILGSPGYMSPEQAQGRPVGPPSDVFSLGAVLAFAAAGVVPFGTGSVAALIYRVVNEPPDLSQVPAELRALLERCLAKAPADRPGVDELLAAVGADPIPWNWLPDTVAGTLSRYEPAARIAALAPPESPATGNSVPAGNAVPAGTTGPAGNTELPGNPTPTGSFSPPGNAGQAAGARPAETVVPAPLASPATGVSAAQLPVLGGYPRSPGQPEAGNRPRSVPSAAVSLTTRPSSVLPLAASCRSPCARPPGPGRHLVAVAPEPP